MSDRHLHERDHLPETAQLSAPSQPLFSLATISQRADENMYRSAPPTYSTAPSTFSLDSASHCSFRKVLWLPSLLVFFKHMNFVGSVDLTGSADWMISLQCFSSTQSAWANDERRLSGDKLPNLHRPQEPKNYGRLGDLLHLDQSLGPVLCEFRLGCCPSRSFPVCSS